jgi:1,4-alpha-glucan branching enzyme
MSRIARQRPRAEGLTLRGLNQLARELVLATASDWLFMISMETTVAYAESRVRTQINRFNHLLEQIDEGTIDADWLSRIEACDNIFPYIDYHDFARLQHQWNGQPPTEATAAAALRPLAPAGRSDR